mmetsp:Transcript_17849/g.22440  ORF Transcript_17849/g.22440 Transcript_17849/m.22440 type:complete len:95 (+) Transcript_17849:397-681(+)
MPNGCDDCELLCLVACESCPLVAIGAQLFCCLAFIIFEIEFDCCDDWHCFLARLIELLPGVLPTETILAPEKFVSFGFLVVIFGSVSVPPSFLE